MKKLALVLLVLCLVGCARSATTPTATPAPTVAPTPEPTPLPSPVPPPPVPVVITYPGNLGSHVYDADYDWGCVAAEGETCLNGLSSPTEEIARSVYMQNGYLSPLQAVSMLQLLDNRMRLAWECADCNISQWKLLNPVVNEFRTPYVDLDSASRARLALFILSEANPDSFGVVHPAFNSWAEPFPYAIVNSRPTTSDLYAAMLRTVENWLDGRPIKMTLNGTQYVPMEVLQRNKYIIYEFTSIGAPNLYLDEHRSLRMVENHLGQPYYFYYTTFPYGE